MSKYTKLLSALCIISMGMCTLSGCGSKSDDTSSAASYRGVFSAPNSVSDNVSDSVSDSGISSDVESEETDIVESVASVTVSSQKEESSQAAASSSGNTENIAGIQRNGKNYFNEVPQLPQPDYLPGVSFKSRDDLAFTEYSGSYFYEYSVDPSLDTIEVLKLYGDELEQIDFETYDNFLDDAEDPMISLSESRGDKEFLVLIYPDDENEHIIDVDINTFSKSTDSESLSGSASSSTYFGDMYSGFWLSSYIIDDQGKKHVDDSGEELYLSVLGTFAMELNGEDFSGTWKETEDSIVLNFDDKTNSVAYGELVYSQYDNYLEIRFVDVDGAFGYIKE